LSNIDNNLPIYTIDVLSIYNGDDLTKPVLIAYDGYVYDVSPGREEFYNHGMDYHYLTGRDSTKELNIVGGSIIKKKYKIIGILK
jgi:predicted heme/steroid binding protein